MSAGVDELADRILTFLHLCEEEDKADSLYVPLSSMDGAVPLGLSDARSEIAPQLLIPVNDGRPALWPVDVKVVSTAHQDWGWPDGTFVFRRVRSIRRNEARSLGASRFSPFMVMDEVVAATPAGTAMSARCPRALMAGHWVNAAPHSIPGALNDEDAIAALIGCALAFRYEWSVWLGYHNGPRIRFLTDPLGAREVFRLRDIPPGRERRAALRHWVSAHARKPHRDMDGECRTWVRRHLRGATDFTWNGLRCRIQPDEYELERMANAYGESRQAP